MNTIFVYGSPTCGKTFTIGELSGNHRKIHPLGFPNLTQIVENSRKLNRFYMDYLLLDTDFLFPHFIEKITDVATPGEAWEYWRNSASEDERQYVTQTVMEEFAKLDIKKCIVFTNLPMWERGVEVPLRYARSPEDIEAELRARDALKGYTRDIPYWVSKHAPPSNSILLPKDTYMYPRIIADLANTSNIPISTLTKETK